MDNKYWDKFNKKIAFDTTQKLFFNKYLYKMSIKASCARYINAAKNKPIADYITILERNRALYSSRFSWGQVIKPSADVDLLENLRTVSKLHEFKYRAEASKFSVYTNTEDELKLFHGALTGKYQYLVSDLSSPAANTIALLQQGRILNGNTGFKYKVMLRDGKYDPAAKKQALVYLENLGTNVKLSKTVKGHLASPYSYVWGAWFYVNDLTDLTFLALILPNCIGKTYEITKI